MLERGGNLVKLHNSKSAYYNKELSRVDFLDRRVYKRSEGVYYPSVTSVLEYFPKNKFFESWIKDVGHNADIIIRRAAEDGTAVHNAVEDLLAGKELTWIDDRGNAIYSELVWNMILRFTEFWQTVQPELIHTEIFTYSDTYQYAGTVDLVVKIKDEIWVLDIKTSNVVHKSYDLQIAAYSKALEENKGLKVNRAGILWLKSSKRKQVIDDKVMQGRGWEVRESVDIDLDFKMFKNIYEIYKMEHPVVQPIFKEYPIKVKL